MSGYSLDNVTIDGFRGLRDLRLDDLGLINVLVGPNNCGKTSVLEARPSWQRRRTRPSGYGWSGAATSAS